MNLLLPPMHLVCMFLLSLFTLSGMANNVPNDLETYCTIPITNNTCGDIELYDDILTPLAWIVTIPKGESYDHISKEGSLLTFKYLDHTLVEEWNVICGEEFVIEDRCNGNNGGNSGGTCNINVVNDACDDLKIFTYANGEWVYIAYLQENMSSSLLTTGGAHFVARYNDGSTVDTWQAVCGQSITVTDTCAPDPQTCNMQVTNSSCNQIGIYEQTNSGYTLVNLVNQNQTANMTIVNGTGYIAQYSDGTTVQSWQAWCGESITVNDNCAPANCNITITNSACDVIKVYEQTASGWSLATTVAQGVTVTYATTNGTYFTASYANGTAIQTWQAWCSEQINVTDDCNTNCTIEVTNDACATLIIYEFLNSDWTSVGTVAQGSSGWFNTTSGSYFLAKYADGSTVDTWQAWCGEDITITDTCTPSGCSMKITNNTCAPIYLQELQSNGTWETEEVIAVGAIYYHPMQNGQYFRASYANGTIVSSWQGWCDEIITLSDSNCNPGCSMQITNNACEPIYFSEYISGDWELVSVIAINQTLNHPMSNGDLFIAKYADGTTVKYWQGWCDEDVVVDDSGCTNNCTMEVTNDACETIIIMQYLNGVWGQQQSITVGASAWFNIANANYFKAIYSDGTVVHSWQAWCGEDVVVNDTCSNNNCTMKITNDACYDIYVMRYNNGAWATTELVGVGDMAWIEITNGDYFKAVYSDGTTVHTWQSWCNEDFTITDECTTPDCTLQVTNNACETVKLYENHYNTWVLIAVLGENQTCTHETTNSASWKAEYADGSHVRSWQAWCDEDITLTDQCYNSCPLTVRNNACETVKLYEKINNNWIQVAVLGLNQSCTHETTNGATWKAQYADGSHVRTWQAWCNENITLTDQCAPACELTVTNNACESIKLYEYQSSNWEVVEVIAVNESCTHETNNGASWKATYADGSTVQSWQAWCNEDVTVTDDCDVEYCSVYIQNNACDELTLYKRNGTGSYALVGKVRVGETFWQNSSSGTQYKAEYADGSIVDTWTAWCGETFVVSDMDCDDPVEECDIYFKNETCYVIKVSVNSGGSYTLLGSIAVGATYEYSAVEGTEFKFQYEDGSIIMSWVSKCNQIFNVQGDCDADPCENVTISAIQLVGVYTDGPPIVLTDGQEIDLATITDQYYIECVTSDAAQSVSFTVNDDSQCEDYLPYTYPAFGENENAWLPVAGTYTIMASAHASNGCTDACATEQITITILEEDSGNGDCTLEIETKSVEMMCDGTVTLSALATNASECDGGGTNIPEDVCTEVVDFAGYIADPAYGSGCADNNGIALSGSVANATTYTTFDLGDTYPSDVEICATMRLRHCIDTDQAMAIAHIQGSMDMRGVYASLQTFEITNESYIDYCFRLSEDTRYIKIDDMMACSFRIDAVTIPQTSVGFDINGEVTYEWYNSNGEVVGDGETISIDETGNYYVIATDCAGCAVTSQDIEVTTLFDETCDVDGGVISLAGGATELDYCIGEPIDLSLNLFDVNGDFSTWIFTDEDGTILEISADEPTSFSSDAPGICSLYHLSYYNVLENLAVGENTSDFEGVYDLSNAITITRYNLGDGPCNSSAKDDEGDVGFRSNPTNQLNLTVYPNPTVDYLYVNMEQVGDLQDWTYEILSMDGKRIMSNKLDHNKIDVTSIGQNGLYLLKLTHLNQDEYVLRFIKH